MRLTCSVLAMFHLLVPGGATAQELDTEYPLQDEPAQIARLGDLMRRNVEENASSRGHHRGFHAKAHACLHGTLEAVPDRPAELRQGIFRDDRSYPVWARFSNGNKDWGDDRDKQPLGLAVKVIGVDGEQLLEDRAGERTQDLLAVNSPVFPTRDIREFAEMVEAGRSGRMLWFLATHPHTAVLLMQHLDGNVGTLLASTYFSGGAVRWGQRASKFFFEPCTPIRAERPADASPDYLRADLVQRMRSAPACFRLMVQLQRDARRQPIEDASIEWSREEAPPVHVATLRLPAQQFDSPAQQQFCEQLAFSPWHGVAEHRPLGNIMRARRHAYRHSQEIRRDRNGAPAYREPSGDERFE